MNRIIEKLSNNILLNIIRNSFVSLMPLTIVSSFFVLIRNFPVPAVTSFMEKTFPNIWNDVLLSIPNAFNNIISLYLVVTIAYFYSKEINKDPLLWILNSIFAFFVFTNFKESESILESLGTNGIFYSMFISLLSSLVLKKCFDKKREISLHKSVPKEVSNSFSYILPVLYSSVILLALKLVLVVMGIENLSEKINQLIQTPISQLGSSLPAIIFINFGITFLWFFGFNGSYLFNSIMNPIYFSLNLENMNAILAGNKPENIITGSFQSLFIQFGGSGSTIALIIAILLFSKDKQTRNVGKLGIIPSIFNINEPVVYGYPIILNFKILPPFLICPIINTIITYSVMYVGIVEKTNGIQIPWTTPPIISGFIVSGISGSILQIFLILINVVIYTPFIKRDKIGGIIGNG